MEESHERLPSGASQMSVKEENSLGKSKNETELFPQPKQKIKKERDDSDELHTGFAGMSLQDTDDKKNLDFEQDKDDDDDEPRSKLHEGHKPSQQSPTKCKIEVVTWNINKGSCSEKSTVGFSKTRDLFTKTLFDKYPSTFACIQEPQVEKVSGLENFSHPPHNKRDGAVGISPKKNYSKQTANDNEDTENNDDDAGHVHKIPEKIINGEHVYKVEDKDLPPNKAQSDRKTPRQDTDTPNAKHGFKQRYHCKTIQIFDTAQSSVEKKPPLYQFILTSYHGEYKGGEIGKVIKFFNDMCQIVNEKQMPMIIGGDFNHSITDLRKAVDKEKMDGQVKVARDYPKGPRRKKRDGKIIDTIVIVNPEAHTCTKCEIKQISAIKLKLIKSDDEANSNDKTVDIRMADLEKILK